MGGGILVVRKENILEFEFLYKDMICSWVRANFTTGVVESRDYVDELILTVFGKQEHNIDNLLLFFEERVFPSSRPDTYEMLEVMGLKEYNPLDICKKTHGKCLGDELWIRFKGEDLDWETVKDMYWEGFEEQMEKRLRRMKEQN